MFGSDPGDNLLHRYQDTGDRKEVAQCSACCKEDDHTVPNTALRIRPHVDSSKCIARYKERRLRGT